jgi:RimJ/RimL family protein N-acetyltransferase
MSYLFQSERLGFRLWQSTDIQPLATLCADPEVMRYFLNPLTTPQAEALCHKIVNQFEQHGYGPYAVELLDNGAFIGFIGFAYCEMDTDFAPCTEILWRLSKEYWGHGYAPEGAQACIAYRSSRLGTKEIYSFTATLNKPSERVMQKIGMVKKGEFDHPNVPEGHKLQRHVLYKKSL